jgi:hypothetical protein
MNGITSDQIKIKPVKNNFDSSKHHELDINIL